MRLSKLGLVLVLSTALLTLGAPATTAEDPHNRECAGVGPIALLCAGADAGTNADCVNVSPSEITCTYTYGWNLNASSDVQLPGGGRLAWNFTVSACISGPPGICMVWEMGGGERDCSWTLNAAAPCWEHGVHSGERSFDLEPGQCVTLTPSVRVSAEAWSPQQAGAMWHAAVEDESANGGAACSLDDGR